jgi:hypothetical protein
MKMNNIMRKYLNAGIFSITIIVVSILFVSTACSSNSIPKLEPWSNAKVFTDNNKKIIVNTNDSFVIGFKITYDRFPIIKEIYDNNAVILLDSYYVSNKDSIEEYVWFLFKALKSGETKITIDHRQHLSLDLVNQKTFSVEIK